MRPPAQRRADPVSRKPSARSGHLALLALLFGAGYVMLADYVNLGHAQQLEGPATLRQLPLPQPWGGHAWLKISLRAGASAEVDPAAALEVLEARVRNYPIYPRHWLDLARIHARQGEDQRVDVLLRKAHASRPEARDALWSAAQIALQSGNAALAERQLRLWLAEFPRDTERALFIGSRWIETPGELLDRMLPQGRSYLAEAMDVAQRQRDPALAEAVWTRLDPRPGLDDPAFLDYAELLLGLGQIDRLSALWAERDPAYDGSGVANGDFSRPLGDSSALNWRTSSAPSSVRIERDDEIVQLPPASLRVTFNGKENIRLVAPRIVIPVEAGRHYRLSGAWRAETLSTRSLPYWYLTADQGELRERIGVPENTFDWERWQIEFQAPEQARLLRLQLRRDRTDNFDRNIGGTLWLDDIALERIPAPAPVPTIPELLRGSSGG